MMKKISILLALVCTLAVAKDEPKVTYVGLGRYTCSGSSAVCAQIDQNNRALEAQRQAREEARRERERNNR